MTVQVGWIGGRERQVSEIVPFFEQSESTDLNTGSNVVRSKKLQSFLTLKYLNQADIARSYDFLNSDNTLSQWKQFRLSANPSSKLVMATFTAASKDFDTHSRSPAITYREVDGFKLMISTTGQATACLNYLGKPKTIGDVENITDWVVEQGLDNLEKSIQHITQAKCKMNMVFTLIDSRDHFSVYILRSKLADELDTEPYLFYSFNSEAIYYASNREWIEKLSESESSFLKEESFVKFSIT